MPTTTVRLTQQTHSVLRDLANREGISIQNILEKMVSQYQRRAILEAGNQAYSQLKRAPKAWAAELAERKAWDATLGDGLKD